MVVTHKVKTPSQKKKDAALLALVADLDAEKKKEDELLKCATIIKTYPNFITPTKKKEDADGKKKAVYVVSTDDGMARTICDFAKVQETMAAGLQFTLKVFTSYEDAVAFVAACNEEKDSKMPASKKPKIIGSDNGVNNAIAKDVTESNEVIIVGDNQEEAASGAPKFDAAFLDQVKTNLTRLTTSVGSIHTGDRNVEFVFSIYPIIEGQKETIISVEMLNTRGEPYWCWKCKPAALAIKAIMNEFSNAMTEQQYMAGISDKALENFTSYMYQAVPYGGNTPKQTVNKGRTYELYFLAGILPGRIDMNRQHAIHLTAKKMMYIIKHRSFKPAYLKALRECGGNKIVPKIESKHHDFWKDINKANIKMSYKLAYDHMFLDDDINTILEKFFGTSLNQEQTRVGYCSGVLPGHIINVD